MSDFKSGNPCHQDNDGAGHQDRPHQNTLYNPIPAVSAAIPPTVLSIPPAAISIACNDDLMSFSTSISSENCCASTRSPLSGVAAQDGGEVDATA